MTCPTCGHPMTNLSAAESIFWCARCGTVQRVAPAPAPIERACRPALVGLAWDSLFQSRPVEFPPISPEQARRLLEAGRERQLAVEAFRRAMGNPPEPNPTPEPKAPRAEMGLG